MKYLEDAVFGFYISIDLDPDQTGLNPAEAYNLFKKLKQTTD